MNNGDHMPCEVTSATGETRSRTVQTNTSQALTSTLQALSGSGECRCLFLALSAAASHVISAAAAPAASANFVARSISFRSSD